MTERVFSLGRIAIDPEEEWISQAIHPSLAERPAWLKHIRIYEWAPELADVDALDVLADALEIRHRVSVDEVIRESGIVGCWRPSTILVQRFTDYGANRLLIDNATIAHALWNIDLHAICDRQRPFGLELLNDEKRLRHLRVTISLVELTDAELQPGQDQSTDTRFLRQERRLVALEKSVKVLGKFARRSNDPLISALLDEARKDDS